MATLEYPKMLYKGPITKSWANFTSMIGSGVDTVVVHTREDEDKHTADGWGHAGALIGDPEKAAKGKAPKQQARDQKDASQQDNQQDSNQQDNKDPNRNAHQRETAKAAIGAASPAAPTGGVAPAGYEQTSRAPYDPVNTTPNVGTPAQKF